MANSHKEVEESNFDTPVHVYKVHVSEGLKQENITPNGSQISNLSYKEFSLIVTVENTDVPTSDTFEELLYKKLVSRYDVPKLVDIHVVSFERIFADFVCIGFEE